MTLIHSIHEHIGHMSKVLRCLREHGLYTKAEKCEFQKKELSFLSYSIGPQGVGMERNKVAAVLNWPEPQSVKDLQSFLGFTNIYHHFIRGFSTVAVLLTDLLNGKKALSQSQAQFTLSHTCLTCVQCFFS